MSVENLRNLPINIVPENQLWMICGAFTDRTRTSEGVLEWCYDEEDAKAEFERLSRDSRYGSLTVSRYVSDQQLAEEESTRRDVETAVELQETFSFQSEDNLSWSLQNRFGWNSHHAEEIAELAWIELYAEKEGE